MMSQAEIAETQRKLCELAEMSLEIVRLDEFIAQIEGAPVVDAGELRELAIAAAAFQRVVHGQVELAAVPA